MTKINLEELRIDFPEKPCKIWADNPDILIYDYQSTGYLFNQKVGYITISIASPDSKEKDWFYFSYLGSKIIPLPVVSYQSTEEEYRGQSISGGIIILSNEITKRIFKHPLISDTNFLQNKNSDWKKKGYARYPGMRVWQKLEDDSLAYYHPYDGEPRWMMY
jgi:hypothetical protein